MTTQGFDNFGLSLVPEGTRISPVQASWSALCSILDIPHSKQLDPDTVVPALIGALDVQEYVRAAAVSLMDVLESVGLDPVADGLVPLIEGMASDRGHAERLLQVMEQGERLRFMNAAVPVFPPATVLTLTHAAAYAFHEPMSEPLRALLRKLAGQAEAEREEGGGRASQAFRSLSLDLAEMWAAARPGHGPQPVTRGRTRPPSGVAAGPLRVLQVSLETGAVGPTVRSALAEQAAAPGGRLRLLELLKRAPQDGAAADVIATEVATDDGLRALFTEDTLDLEGVDLIIARMGLGSVRPLLDVLIDAKHRTTRRAILDRLAKLGPAIHPFVMERVFDTRWFVVRNMIGLLREAGCSLDGVPLERFGGHYDPRVRREALRLQVENPALREPALVEALRDSDDSVLRTALQAARTGLPETAVPVLARRLGDPMFPPDLRVLGLFLLGRTRSVLALDTLLAHAQGGRSMLGRPRLAPKSPEMLAALGGLARSFPTERRAAALLDVARRSTDEQVRSALHSPPGGG
jgi:hypothetical protein